MLKNYVKIALRNFLKKRGYSIINVLGLSVGIAGCLIVFMFVRDEISFDRFNTNYEQIYRLRTDMAIRGEPFPGGSTAPVMGEAIAEEVPEVQKFARIRPSSRLVRQGDEVERERILFVDPDLFEIFSFPFKEGDPGTAFNNINSIVIDEEVASKYFPDQSPIGKTMEMEFAGEFQSVVVTGVMQKIPTNSSLQFDMAMPFSKYRQLAEERRFTTWLDLHITTFFQIGPQADLDAITIKMDEMLDIHAPDEPDFQSSLRLQSLSDIHLNNDVRTSNGMQAPSDPLLSKILLGIGFFILLIACINFTNLSIGMSLPRAKEIGLRKVIGASKKQLALQFLGEAFSTSLIAYFLAILWTDLSLPTFNLLTGKFLVLWQSGNIVFIAISFSLVILTTFLAGGYPAFVVSRFNTIDSLKGKLKVAAKNHASKGLVVLQFSLAVFLIIGAITVNRQVDFMVNSDLGYEDEGLIAVLAYGENGDDLLGKFKNRLSNYSHIQHITGDAGSQDRTDVAYGDLHKTSYHVRIDYDFLKATKIPLVAGRDFSEEIPSDSTTGILVNEQFVKAYQIEDPIGAEIGYTYFENMENPRIIGVMKDFHFLSMRQEIEPILYHVNPMRNLGIIYVKVEKADIPMTIDLLENTWKELVAYRPFRYNIVEDLNNQAYAEENDLKNVISYASFLAILISCMGLFGLATLHIQQRTKEIGIRKVLGASLSRVVMILSKNFTALILLAVVLATPFAYWILSGWLDRFANKTPLEPSIFILAATSIVGLAWITIAYQAIRTALANPVNSLRDE